jgi:2-polyprenyl-3-methyl-5-hydroxy-6-metoxy-1,4-benzoquinol methylase
VCYVSIGPKIGLSVDRQSFACNNSVPPENGYRILSLDGQTSAAYLTIHESVLGGISKSNGKSIEHGIPLVTRPQMKINEGIRVFDVPACALCGQEGYPLYRGLRDRLFEAPGTWDLYTCPQCQLIWMNPRPVPEDTDKLYLNYFTHDQRGDSPKSIWMRRFVDETILCNAFGYSDTLRDTKLKWLGKFFAKIGPLKSMSGMRIMYLDGNRRGSLLDVGCGNGLFLLQMRNLGWNVCGIEPDPEAARAAREHSDIPVFIGTLEDSNLASESLDAVTMRHVIEHTSDPVGTLRECYRVLKPGGIVVIDTPNSQSLGHQLLRSAWRGLEIPRHYFVFSMKALSTCADYAGFDVRLLSTAARHATGMHIASRLIQRGSTIVGKHQHARKLKFEGLLFRLVEELALAFWNRVGEEVLLVGEKPAGQSTLYANIGETLSTQ